MTDNEIFETEIKCINRRANGQCNGGTDCCNCDLLMNEEDIISAYERAMSNFALINRLKAELDESREKNAGLALALLHEVVNEDEQLRNEITKVAKSEARKEFVERLLRKANLIRNDLGTEGFVTIDDIYETLKEMEYE